MAKVSAIVDFTAGLPPGSPVAINYDNISVNGKGSTKKTYLFLLKRKYFSLSTIKNKLAKLRRHASRVHFAKILFAINTLWVGHLSLHIHF